jgi:hypothetical protein
LHISYYTDYENQLKKVYLDMYNRIYFLSTKQNFDISILLLLLVIVVVYTIKILGFQIIGCSYFVNLYMQQ